MQCPLLLDQRSLATTACILVHIRLQPVFEIESGLYNDEACIQCGRLLFGHLIAAVSAGTHSLYALLTENALPRSSL